MRKYLATFGTSRWPWIMAVVAVTIAMSPWLWLKKPALFSTYGGLICVLGAGLLSISTWRKEKKVWLGDISDDTFYKWGTGLAMIGTLIWAAGENILARI